MWGQLVTQVNSTGSTGKKAREVTTFNPWHKFLEMQLICNNTSSKEDHRGQTEPNGCRKPTWSTSFLSHCPIFHLQWGSREYLKERSCSSWGLYPCLYSQVLSKDAGRGAHMLHPFLPGTFHTFPGFSSILWWKGNGKTEGLSPETYFSLEYVVISVL